MSNLVSCFIEITKWGFTLTFLLLFIGYFILLKWRPFIKQWLFAACLIMLVCCIAELVSQGFDYIDRLKFVQEARAKYNTGGYNFWYGPNNELHYYPLFALLLSSVLLFIFKRRLNYFVWGGLVSIALHYEAIYDAVYIAILNLRRDYLPSSWSVEYADKESHINKYLLCFAVFNAVVTCIYFYKRVMDKRRVKTT